MVVTMRQTNTLSSRTPVGRTAGHRWRGVMAILVLVVTAGVVVEVVGRSTEPIPRDPIDATAVQHAADRHVALWAAAEAALQQDPEQLRGLFADDVQLIDRTFGARTQGIDDVVAEQSAFLWFASMHGTEFQLREPGYVAPDGVLAFSEMGPISLRGGNFTVDDPLVAVDRFDISADRITTWQAYVALDALRQSSNIDPEELVDLDTILRGYADAWSSGDSNRAAAPYADDAALHDAFFSEPWEGRDQITAYARQMREWYPALSVGLHETFADIAPNPTVGGIVTLHVLDDQLQPCDVRAVVVLDTEAGTIVRERRYYDVQTLSACDWIR
jgi:hypothetical protein